jgi:hypothetical protein
MTERNKEKQYLVNSVHKNMKERRESGGREGKLHYKIIKK